MDEYLKAILFLIISTSIYLGIVVLIDRRAQKQHSIWYLIMIPIIVGFIISVYLFLCTIIFPSVIVLLANYVILLVGSFITLIVAINIGLKNKHKYNQNILSYVLLSVIITPFITGFAYIDTSIYINQCERIHISEGNKIIIAIEQYCSDHNTYPQYLRDLIPDYLPMDSNVSCFRIPSLLGLTNNIKPNTIYYYGYKRCDDGITQLSIPELGSEQYHIYNMQNKRWIVTSGEYFGLRDTIEKCQ